MKIMKIARVAIAKYSVMAEPMEVRVRQGWCRVMRMTVMTKASKVDKEGGQSRKSRASQ